MRRGAACRSSPPAERRAQEAEGAAGVWRRLAEGSDAAVVGWKPAEGRERCRGGRVEAGEGEGNGAAAVAN